MKYWLSTGILILLINVAHSQKLILDSSSFTNWLKIENPKLSDDGKYVIYTLRNVPSGDESLVVKSSFDNWEIRFSEGSSNNCYFIDGGSKLIITIPKDSLILLDLATRKVKSIKNVRSYKYSQSKTLSFLACQTSDSLNSLLIYSLDLKLIRSYPEVINYSLSDKSNDLILTRKSESNATGKLVLEWINLNDYSKEVIWSGEKITQIAFNSEGERIAFIVQEKIRGNLNSELYYYDHKKKSLYKITDDNMLKDSGYMIDNSKVSFSANGDRIYFKEALIFNTTQISSAKVDVWNYNDYKLQSQQLEEINNGIRKATCVYNINLNSLLELVSPNEKVVSLFRPNTSDYIIIEDPKCDFTEWYWNYNNRSSSYLVSTKNGSRYILPSENASLSHFALSPKEKFILYYDYKNEDYFVYEISSKRTINVTKGISTKWTRNEEMSSDKYKPIFSGCWCKNEETLLICDQNDIWQVDPKNRNQPLNLTNGYGKRNNIRFSIVNSFSDSPIYSGNKIIISAFNSLTKMNGFYAINLDKSEDPEMLKMSAIFYHFPLFTDDAIFPPIKAKNANIFLVRAMSAENAPNLYITFDFKTFNKISDVSPERKYNWVKTELIKWKSLDNTELQGVLYKPEDFDSTKMYPIIFSIYEQLSDELNIYKSPEPNGYSISIPLFVSDGYLVFRPDIHYKIGSPCQSACNSIISAANFLKEKKWIDSTKMGIEGHSFGGYEVNCLIGKTNLFAAASEAAGVSDLLSMYGSISQGAKSEHFQVEDRQLRIGSTLWEAPNYYIENSPIFNVSQITTPLLIMHNKNDEAVPWNQGIEMFTALRRLNKKVWMLQYDDEGHQLVNKMNQDDYAIRLKQYFDCILKNKRAPIWMTKGIPALLKGKELGLQLDNHSK